MRTVKSSRPTFLVQWILTFGISVSMAVVNDGTQPVIGYTTGSPSSISVGDLAGGDDNVGYLIFRVQNSEKARVDAGGITIPDATGLSSSISSMIRTMVGRSGTTLNVGDNGGWTMINNRIPAGGIWKVEQNGTTRLQLNGSGRFIVNTSSDHGETFQVDGSGYITGTVALASTLGVSGLITANNGIGITGGLAADGGIWKSGSAGLALRGVAGTSYDLALMNPAGNYLLRNPTGTQNVEVANQFSVLGQSTLTGAIINGGTSGQGGIYTTSTIGLALQGKTGSAYDFSLLATSGAGSYVMRVPTGSTTAEFPNNVSVGGTFTAAGALNSSSSVVTNGQTGFVANGTVNTARDVLNMRTGGINRWIVRNSGGTETGGGTNSGSSFQLLARADNGDAIDNVIDITRAALGPINLNRPVVMDKNLTVNGNQTNLGSLATTTTNLTGTIQTGLSSSITGTTAGTDWVIGSTSRANSAASSYTVANTAAFYASGVTKGPGSTITSQYGLFVDNINQGTNSYAIYTNLGKVRIGDAVNLANTLGVTGSITSNAAASGTGASFVAASTNPTSTWIDTDGGVDEKNWDVQANVGTFIFRTRTDANTTGQTWLTATRSGATVSGITLASNALTITGAVTGASGFASGSDDALLRTVGTGQTAISGGTASNSGANLLLYGGSHATLANNWRLRHGTTTDIAFNGSNITFSPPSFFSSSLAATGLITGTAGFASGNADGMVRTVNNEFLHLSGDVATNVGSNIVLYASAHPQLANNWKIRHGTTNDLVYNGSDLTVTPPVLMSNTLNVAGKVAIGYPISPNPITAQSAALTIKSTGGWNTDYDNNLELMGGTQARPSLRFTTINGGVSKSAWIATDSLGSLYFGVGKNSAPASAGELPMTITAAANVALATNPGGQVIVGSLAPTTTAGVKLNVVGNARVSGTLYASTIKTTSWGIEPTPPDYVFEKGYKLATLDHVEKFVNENKHLPEIPSAKEIMKGGLDLADMNMKLLKKVEELTLYAIEQKKRDKKLEERNKKNEEEIAMLKQMILKVGLKPNQVH